MGNDENCEALAHRQVWLYSAFAAVSGAFFLALLSSGSSLNESILLMFSTILFSVSLTTNSILVYHGMAYSSKPLKMARQTSTSYVFEVQLVAQFSFILAMLFLVWHFSFIAFFVALVAGIFSFYKIYEGMAHSDQTEL